jgi:hypothetical protein
MHIAKLFQVVGVAGKKKISLKAIGAFVLSNAFHYLGEFHVLKILNLMMARPFPDPFSTCLPAGRYGTDQSIGVHSN